MTHSLKYLSPAGSILVALGALVASMPRGAGAAAVTHVVHVSLDGLGAKYLEFYVTNAPAQFPNFVRLRDEGAATFNARCDYDISETVPNHASIFTGRPVMQPTGASDTVHHGYNNNFPGSGDTFHISGNNAVPYKASFFDVAHDYGLSTALYTGKTRLAICDRSYDAVNGAPDLVEDDNGQDKIDFASIADVSGAAIANQVTTLVNDLNLPFPKGYSFIHIAEPDLTGHSAGWGSASWSNAVRLVDTQIGRILDSINASSVLSNQTALIVSADHGGGGVNNRGHTEAYHITNYTIPFFLWAPGIPGGVDAYSLFANRADPGTNRTDYSIQPQPLRNADGANIALALLGLPPIPGSYYLPAFSAPEVTLTIARVEGYLGVAWSDAADEYVLETKETLDNTTEWQTVTEGIIVLDPLRILTITDPTADSTRFFRLRKK
jgi:hypothetical protein